MRIASKLFAIAAVVMFTTSMACGQTILVNFDSAGDGDTTGTSADFAQFDSAVDLSAPVIDFTPTETPTAIAGTGGLSGLLVTSTGGNFAPGAGPTEGVPIFDGFFTTNTMMGGPTSGITSLSNIVGINAGDSVTLTVFAIGDQPDQVSNQSLSINGGAFTPFGVQTVFPTTTPATLAEQIAATSQVTFVAPAGGVTDLEFEVDGIAVFSSTNGFSITVDPAAVAVVPEPGSLALLGLGSLFCLSRRRR